MGDSSESPTPLKNMDKALANYIHKLVEVDQGSRKLNFKGPGSVKGFPNYLVYAIDAVHNYYLHKIIDRYGFPTTKLIGKKSIRDFWILVQHQDFDLELQKECLKKCDFALKEKALLTDRVLVNSNKKQLYGTQFHRDQSGKLVPRPIKDKRNLNIRRKKAGFDSFESYAKKIKKINNNTRKLNLGE